MPQRTPDICVYSCSEYGASTYEVVHQIEVSEVAPSLHVSCRELES